MKKQKDFELRTEVDIKVFLLFILDRIGYPLEHQTIMDIVLENTGSLSLDYDEALTELVASELLCYDTVDDERYYMISDKGRLVSAELYDTLDSGFREKSLKSAIRHVSLVETGARIEAFITEIPYGRYKVTVQAFDHYGERMSTSMTVNSREEAQTIKQNYENKPDAVYRGVLFALTGRLNYIS